MGRVLCMGTMCGYGFSVCVGYYIWVGVLGMGFHDVAFLPS